MIEQELAQLTGEHRRCREEGRRVLQAIGEGNTRQSSMVAERLSEPSSCMVSVPKLANSVGTGQERPFWRFYYVQQDPTNRGILCEPRPIEEAALRDHG